MKSVKVTVTTMYLTKAWKQGVYSVPDEMPVDVAKKLVEIKHAEIMPELSPVEPQTEKVETASEKIVAEEPVIGAVETKTEKPKSKPKSKKKGLFGR